MGEVIALAEVAPQRAQLRELPGGLHALGDPPEAQGMRDGDRGQHDRPVVSIFLYSSHERAVYLQVAYGEALEVRERRVIRNPGERFDACVFRESGVGVEKA